MINIIPTSTTEHLGKLLEGKPDVNVIYSGKNKEEKRYFPDGEVYTRISNINTENRTIILHSGAPDPSSGLVELEMVLEIVNKKYMDKKDLVEVFFTYFPYGRQDKIFKEGETNCAENLVKKLTDYYKVNKVYVIDAHFFGDDWVKKYPILNVSAVPLLIKAASSNYENITYLVPDKGAKKRTGLDGTEKTRTDSYIVEIQDDKKFKTEVPGKVVGAVDDLLQTGGTLCKFHDKCKEGGAKDVIALITHGVLPEGISKIQKKYPKLYLTNTINRPEANVDVTELILKTIQNY